MCNVGKEIEERFNYLYITYYIYLYYHVSSISS